MSQEYFEDIRHVLEGIANNQEGNGEIPAKVTNRMIFAAQAELYRLASSAAAKASDAEEKAEEVEDEVSDIKKNLRALAVAVGIIALVHLPDIIVWLEANWDKIF
jgi:hypothetical protein